MTAVGSGVLRRWVVVAALAALPACVMQRQVTVGQTQVGQGLLYQSSNPTYDKFFEEMHAVQVSAMGALDEDGKARAPLEQALGASKTTPAQLAELTKARTKKNEQSGAQLRLAVTGLSRDKPDEKPAPVSATLTVADDTALASDDRDFVKFLEQSLKSEAELVEKYSQLAASARKLSARSAELLGSAGTDFPVESRRSEVSEELDAAKLILDAVADRSEKISAGALSFLKVLADSIPPPGPATAVAKADASKTKPKKSSSKPASPKPKPEPAAKPVAESVKPAPKPSPAPPKPPEDFNP
jgi:hypothetical protein